MNRSVLISGASHGIGAAAAIEFAKNGYDVGINGNKNPKAAEEVAKECMKYGVKAEIFIGDVGKHDVCKKIMEDFIGCFGRIDVLVNNAGGALNIPGGPNGEFKDMPMEYWDEQIALNLSSAAYLSRYASEDMINKGIKGSIINISSIHSRVTWVHRRMLPYSAGKSGLNMLTKALGVELIRYGINVNGIAPGLIFTKIADRYNEEELKSFSRKIPYGNGGTVDDIVPMIMFLADKEKSKFIVGQTIFIDGGQSVDGSIESMNFEF
ncbi:MAG: SDR family oxidoreductase [Clostridia bacterium]|nr:SDR family oxidoreductase [Clostridia bacterium]